MNPRLWDLAYIDREPLPGIPVILSKINSMGFATVAMPAKEFDPLYDTLPVEWRFCNKELTLAGVENLFIPKPEYKDRIIPGLSSGRN